MTESRDAVTVWADPSVLRGHYGQFSCSSSLLCWLDAAERRWKTWCSSSSFWHKWAHLHASLRWTVRFQVAWVNITVHFTAWTWNKCARLLRADTSTSCECDYEGNTLLLSAVWTRLSPMAVLSSLQASVFISLVRLWSLDSAQSEAPVVQAALLRLTPASWPHLKAWLSCRAVPLSSHSHPAPGSISATVGTLFFCLYVWVTAMHRPWNWSLSQIQCQFI